MASIGARFVSLFSRGTKATEKAIHDHMPLGQRVFSSGRHIHDPILKLIQDCRHGAHRITDPRWKIEVYRGIWDTFPLFSSAADKRAFMVGRPMAVSEDKGLEQALNDMFKTFRIQTSDKNEFAVMTGMNQYMNTMLRTSWENGMAFRNLTGEEGEPVDGAIIFDSAMFDFVRTNMITKLMAFTEQGQIPVEANDFFASFMTEFNPRYNWGIPMTFGTDFMADGALRVMMARRDTHVRRGNPPALTMVSIKDTKNPLDQKQVSDFTAIMGDVAGAWAGTVRHMEDRGKTSDVIAAIPAPIDIQTHMPGKDIPELSDYPQELNDLFAYMHHRAKWPMEFNGFSSGGAGIGSDRFKVLADIQVAVAKDDQDRTSPDIKAIGDTWLQSVGSDRFAADWSVDYDVPSLENLKDIADTEKVEAESLAQQVLNFDNLANFVSPADAEDYAESIGQDWTVPVDSGADPAPDPGTE